MAGKRSFGEAFDEFHDVSQITHTSPKAKIHCVISEIPEEMKAGAGSSFFDGKLSDNKESIRYTAMILKWSVDSLLPRASKAAQFYSLVAQWNNHEMEAN